MSRDELIELVLQIVGATVHALGLVQLITGMLMIAVGMLRLFS